MSDLPTTPSNATKWQFSAIVLILAALTIFLGYFADRNHFLPFITGYGAFFVLYCWVIFFQKGIPAGHLITLGIGLRVLLLFSLPNLSDDYFRFLWDGRLSIAGYHPFLHTPVYFIENQILPTGISSELFQQLNSPNYYTVYPPVCQAVFASAALVAPNNNWIAVLVMKLFLLACEIGVIRLLAISCWPLAVGCWRKKALEPVAQASLTQPPNASVSATPSTAHRLPSPVFRPPSTVHRPPSAVGRPPSAVGRPPSTVHRPSSAVLYALNPLIILELVGNCHFEGVMILFLLLGMLAWQQGAIAKSAGFWALATATKLIPLLFLPLIWRWLGWRKGGYFLLVFGLVSLLFFAPLLAVFPQILESLELYFREFQFNGSIYYLVREVGYANIGWDIGETSGPVLGLVTIIAVMLLALFARQVPEFPLAGLSAAMLFSLFLYLSFAAVVQPWYVCVPFAISLFTHWRFALLWTGLVALSYSHYNGGLRQEHFGLILLEYSVLWGMIIWELVKYFRLKAGDKYDN